MPKIDTSKQFFKLTSKVESQTTKENTQKVSTPKPKVIATPTIDEPVAIEPTADIDIDDFNDEVPVVNNNNTSTQANTATQPQLTVIGVAAELGLTNQEVGSQMGQLMREQGMTQQQALEYIRANASANANSAQQTANNTTTTNNNTNNNNTNNTTNTKEPTNDANAGQVSSSNSQPQINKKPQTDNDKNVKVTTTEELFLNDLAHQEEIVSVEDLARQFNMTPEEVVAEAMNIQRTSELTQKQALLVMRSMRMGEEGTALKIINKAHEENTATMQKYSEQYGISAEDARLLFRAENGLEPVISKIAQLNNMSMLDALNTYKNAQTVTTEDLVAQADKNAEVETTNQEQQLTVVSVADELGLSYQEVGFQLGQLLRENDMNQQQALEYIRALATGNDELAQSILDSVTKLTVVGVAEELGLTNQEVGSQMGQLMREQGMNQQQALRYIKALAAGNDELAQSILDSVANTKQNEATQQASNTTNSEEVKTITTEDLAMSQIENELVSISVEKLAQQLKMEPEKVAKEMMDLQQKYELTPQQALIFIRANAMDQKNFAQRILNSAHTINTATMQRYSEQYGISADDARLLFRAENGLEPTISKIAQLYNVSMLDAVEMSKNMAPRTLEQIQENNIITFEKPELKIDIAGASNNNNRGAVTTEDLFMQNYENEVANISVETVAQQIKMEPQKVAEEMVKLQKQFELTPQQALLVLRASHFKENSLLPKLFSRAHADNTATMKQYSEQYGISADDARLLFRAENGLEPRITKYAQLYNLSLVAAVRTIKNVNQVTTEELASQQNYTILSVADELGLSYNDVGIRMSQLMREQGMTQQQALAYMLQNP